MNSPAQTQLAIETCGPFATNAFLLWNARSAVIIDPAVGATKLLEKARQLQKNGVKIEAIWNTHGHFDHVCDNALWKNEFGAPVFAHAQDEFFLEHLREQAIWFGVAPPEVTKIDAYLKDGERVSSGEISALVHHLPGHSPGSVAFDFGDFWISGDVLFQNSVGRVDLPGGSSEILAQSVKKLFSLPPQNRILPGHGDATTIGDEIQKNAIARQLLAQIG